MNSSFISKLALTLALLFALSACGQKGPLIVEQPTTDTVTTQEEEPAQTK